jgi:hypothetical protein
MNESLVADLGVPDGLRPELQKDAWPLRGTGVREELAQRLWPTGTFVDFDKGLNAAVTRLRQTLSDSAETPRYVETVARRGYRRQLPLLLWNRHVMPASAAVLLVVHGSC